MSDRIQTLVKRIHETLPVQSTRRHALADELQQLRRDLAPDVQPDQLHYLEAALLLLEFMNRSDDVATAETLQTVAGLVANIEERYLRVSGQHGTQAPAQALPQPTPARPGQVHEHRDLAMTQEFLLGSILLQAKLISQQTLTRALHLHASSGMALGECLIQLGAATREQITHAIAYQDSLREQERSSRKVGAPTRTARAAPAAPAAPAAHAPHAPHASGPSGPAGPASGEGRGPLRLSSRQHGYVQSLHSQVLGEILIRLGAITREQLEQALIVQRASGLHIGEALVESGATHWTHIKRALDVQRGLRRKG